MQLKQINKIFGMSLSTIEQNNNNSSFQLNSEIYQNVLSKVENKYGNQFLKFDISPENYMKYKNGKTSSMIKSNTGGIQEHSGFEAVEMVNLVDSIFMEIDRYYTTQIISEFNSSVNQIFRAIDDFQLQINNQFLDFKKEEKIEELASFKDFFEDISYELGEISISPMRATSYITNLIDIKRKNYKIYNFFIEKLNGWIDTISLYYTNSGDYVNNINFQELEKDFYFARQSISTYMICLIYEHIICGNIDIKSKDKIILKLDTFLKKFKEVESKIKNVLIQRYNQNYNNWNWYHSYKQHDNNNINWFLENSVKENFETNIVNNIFNKSANILENVILEEEKDNKMQEEEQV
ncbi:hypothetical protein ACH5BF_07800 [Arcobacter sp. YIC-464]|uniref:hypothetical protein n=1 Tax=Arcobacter sp. YIC-464 TaxID=3376631 RepID=UPI003C17FB56